MSNHTVRIFAKYDLFSELTSTEWASKYLGSRMARDLNVIDFDILGVDLSSFGLRTIIFYVDVHSETPISDAEAREMLRSLVGENDVTHVATKRIKS